MKKSLLITIVAFVLLIVIAVFGYNYLSDNYKPEGTLDISEETASAAPKESTDEKVLAPDFTLLDANETEVSFSDFKNKPVVINFWATWCGFCVKEFPAFQNVYDEYKDKVNFMMVNVTDGQQETIKSAKAFIQENNYTFPVYYDTELTASNIYGAYSIPITVLIDSDGYYLGTHQGAMEEETLRNYIKSLIGE